MAIVIEEEKKHSGLGAVIGWLIIVAILAAAIYYVFFAAPELSIIPPSGTLSIIEPITQSPPDINAILNNPVFKTLVPPPTQPVATTTGSSGGRPNPFTLPQ
ncbi:MAG TPA: hypothetical protein VMT99_01850 [Candidatus Paceibacterota bacterium]|nr:hypothetical protein [Candidatus Paceibacterota bacterium]